MIDGNSIYKAQSQHTGIRDVTGLMGLAYQRESMVLHLSCDNMLKGRTMLKTPTLQPKVLMMKDDGE